MLHLLVLAQVRGTAGVQGLQISPWELMNSLNEERIVSPTLWDSGGDQRPVCCVCLKWPFERLVDMLNFYWGIRQQPPSFWKVAIKTEWCPVGAHPMALPLCTLRSSAETAEMNGENTVLWWAPCSYISRALTVVEEQLLESLKSQGAGETEKGDGRNNKLGLPTTESSWGLHDTPAICRNPARENSCIIWHDWPAEGGEA